MRKLAYILVLNFLLSCSHNKNIIDKSIVLKIGSLEITRYEFEKNKRQYLILNVTDSSALINPGKLAAWKKNYIDKCIIISDAYNKGYDTIASIQNQIKHVGNFMMIQRYGYLL